MQVRSKGTALGLFRTISGFYGDNPFIYRFQTGNRQMASMWFSIPARPLAEIPFEKGVRLARPGVGQSPYGRV
jgi:hypothetical protein